ncbi:hypothetical protein OIU85_026789 [Salix viminalis]|uniref:RING-type E3 ubiquitin transferase (cysteine targeting) n=1 Tax=Salix viminalis TaxID=40686 RepID=A0A9Q0TPN4_SALVM|nr:hypothetical protein OIU85_026789 [Salix viminalis]
MSSSNLSPPPPPPPPPPEDEWIRTYLKFIPGWQSLPLSHQSMIPISISRVNQFDAARLDIEMSAILKEQLVKVFSLMKPGMLFQYEPELDAFLEFLIWRFSIWVDKPTPGNALMNLRYRDETCNGFNRKRWACLHIQCLWRCSVKVAQFRTGLEGPGLTIAQKIWYCIATAGGQYTWARLQSFSAFRAWEATGKACMDFDTAFRNLIERVLQARLVYGSPNMNRAVSFEYVNRQLVWNEFSEMLLLLLPLLNSQFPLFHFLLFPVSTGTATTASVHDVLQPHHFAAPVVASQWLLCSAMAAKPGNTNPSRWLQQGPWSFVVLLLVV